MGGGSAALITAAIEASYPLPLSRLATNAGISRFAAQRAIERLRETGVLTSDGDGWEFNDDHPLASLLCQLAWPYSGAQRPPAWEPYWVNIGGWQDEYRYQRIIPPSLLHPKKDDHTSTHEGPDLLTVRDTVTWAWERVHELREFERDGQEVFAVWSTERLRDMIHQTLHLGSPTAQAIGTLTAATSAGEQRKAHTLDNDPRLLHISALTWARATYLIAADLWDVRRVVTILKAAIRETGPMHSRRSAALGNLEQVAGSTTDHLGLRESLIDEAVHAAADARAIWADDAPEIPYKHIGGFPQPVDVGTAGDKIYAIRLVRVGTRLAEMLTKMSTHPSLDAWKTAHPDEAEEYPLCTQAPEIREQLPKT